jgi:hypothetical protein
MGDRCSMCDVRFDPEGLVDGSSDVAEILPGAVFHAWVVAVTFATVSAPITPNMDSPGEARADTAVCADDVVRFTQRHGAFAPAGPTLV